MDYFSGVFAQHPEVQVDYLFLVAGPSLSADQDLHLTAVRTAMEVRDGVFSMKKNSSPGPEKFTGAFYTFFFFFCFQVKSPLGVDP